MENPQAENGHIDIANEIADQFCHLHLSGNEWMVLWVVLRKTWGWHKKEDMVSLTQFQKLTGLSRWRVNESIKQLVTKRILVKDKRKFVNNYGFNKLYSQWNSHQNVTSHDIETGVVTKTVPKLVTKTVHTKEKKETNTKETILRIGTSYGNQDINDSISYLKEKMELPKLDLSEKINRQYAWTLIRKSKTGLSGVKWLIDLASSDPWHKNHISSMRDLWNNQVKIVQNKRGGANRYVDITSDEWKRNNGI